MGAAGLQPFRIWGDALLRLAGDLRGVFLRALLVVLIALGLTALLSSTTFYNNLESTFTDWAHNLLAVEERYADVVVIDADQESLDILAPDLGQWPYPRAATAQLIRYVNRAGAAAIVLTPQLELPTDDDDTLVAAIRQAGNIALGARGLDTKLPRNRDFELRLESQAWFAKADDKRAAPLQDWPEFGMPLPPFIDPALGAVVGLNTVAVTKKDNNARYVPLLHRARGQVLPTLALAAFAAQLGTQSRDVNYFHGARELGYSDQRWPVDEKGRVWPIVPLNISNMPVIPMWQILVEAAGDKNAEFFADELRNRVVFIGSTAAQQSDYYQTPQGRVAGLHLLANTYHSLQHGRLLVPPSSGLNVFLAFLALMLPLLTLRNKWSRLAVILTVASLGALLITMLFLGFLLIGKQLTDPLNAYLILILATVVLIAFRAKFHVDQGQKLFYAKQSAEDANKLKSEFLAQMTHELRTPLTAVIGFNRLMVDQTFNEADRGSYLSIIDSNCQHLLQLINNILDHSKLVAGQMLIEPDVVNVPEMLRSTTQSLLPLADEKGLEIQLTIDESMPDRLQVDQFRLRQVLLNILGNAIKFTRQGFISLTADWDNGWLDIAIEDSGVGIPDSVRERIFESFQQADGSISKTYGGTGLGLSISRDLVQLMGGRIGAESEEGVGSTFYINMPAPYARPPERNLRELPVPKEEPVEMERIAGSRILVADDNPDIRALVKVYMKSANVQVHAVENGLEAVGYALTERPDLVLMDMEMPVMDGYAAIAKLRSRGFKAPIIGFTAHSSDEIQKTISDLGANSCVRKPVAKATLLNAVYKALTTPNENQL